MKRLDQNGIIFYITTNYTNFSKIETLKFWAKVGYYTQLRLDPLSMVSADAFLQALLGHDPSLLSLIPILIQRTEGNPF
ncbi:MAG TPA: hypothetical protein VIT23_14995, partial [Terrimicrobiaceae bacterium]